ncbi:uncharacterized protein VTP21DRAFT_1692 [Calcarisporiella thermophila]|uniref:uncharacterized protein n=1 Tax=Calcarisporiella thermophila TaxID=911321 RepID=UPI0037430DE1
MVKAYLRYEQRASFGVVTSGRSNVVHDANGRLAVAPALEDVVLWDLKKGTLIGRWHDADNKAEVTCIARSPNNKDYAVGYSDGAIRLWNIDSGISTVLFNGHRGAVTALAFDKLGARLASGATDTDLIVWDVVGEVGLYRMRGHKDQVTCIRFLNNPLSIEELNASSSEYILTASKDTLLKLWDLSTQHCVETIVGHRSEVWAFDISQDGRNIVSGGGDHELFVWHLDWERVEKVSSNEETNEKLERSFTLYGRIERHSKERVSEIRFHSSQKFLGVQVADRSVEIFRIRTEEEIRKKMARRKKRQREKAQKKGKSDKEKEEENMQVDGEEGDENIAASDEIAPYQIIRTPAKVRSFDFAPVQEGERSGFIKVLVALMNNSLEVYNVALPPKSKSEEIPDPSKIYSVDLQGHRSDIRTVSLSSDDELLCTASNGLLKVWNVKANTCIRTIECGYALCSTFLPGNRHILIGTKSGDLELFDIASSSLVESIHAHEGAIWSMQVRPDKRGLVTGSADKDVKFWDFNMIEENVEKNAASKKRLTLVHIRTLKMSDDVLCVRYSPNQDLIAVSLLDSTVKVFYHDTLKFYLSLYGHKLPVLSMDISSDNGLLVTCSADKNVKIWGLDFGDCHKSIFAHQESIMCVQFVWGTHYFFTVSKDRTIKYWDGDKFENIMKLEGHHGEIWALAVGKHGNFIVSASHDRSIRIWERTEEQLFLEEEREKELEELYESSLANTLEKTGIDDTGEVGAAGKRTMETLKAGERIIESIEVADEERNEWEVYNELRAKGQNPPPPQRNPILLAMGDLTPEQYVLRTIEKVRSSELEEALLVLPFDKVISLLGYLNEWIRREWSIPLACRILFYLLRVHHHQIVANRVMRPRLDAIRGHLRSALQRQKDVIGYNLAALKYIRGELEAQGTAEFFDDKMVEETMTKKRKFVTITAS